ncbi:addiction module antitoxin [Psychrosphaera saromensis]|uniref:Antitoxin ParD n=2 Tax=Psychrosphaera saromensis TaxID=716813 RepID=A0A2S7UZH1_9GAMM|nr:addiction module antitoxin [Psychrosphaera saromensis]
MIKKSITVTDQQEQWIQAQMATGNYASDSEVLRDLIRKEQMRNTQIESIRNELIKAEGRGFTDKTPEEIMQDVIKRKQADVEL